MRLPGPRRFRLRQPEIDAVQWTGENIQDVAELLGYMPDYVENIAGVIIQADQPYIVYVGTWIAKNPKTKAVFPISAEALRNAYEVIIPE